MVVNSRRMPANTPAGVASVPARPPLSLSNLPRVGFGTGAWWLDTLVKPW